MESTRWVEMSEVVSLTGLARSGNVSRMLRPALAGVCFAGLLPSSATAQQVPGRDLLDFQIGTMAEAPALAHLTGEGLWNPASISIPAGLRVRIAAATLQTPSEQGVSSELLAAGVRVHEATTVGLSLVRAEVTGLLRTDTDPQTVGGDIPYNTTVVSLAVAQRREDLIVGFALRYRHGQLDELSRGAVGIDAGLILEDLLFGRARVAASTFLWRPGGNDTDAIGYNLAADARVFGTDSLREARTGYGITFDDNELREQFGYVSGRYGVLEARTGIARYSALGYVDWRLRLGLGLHYARYTVGISREENGAGLDAVYQFTLSAFVK